MRRSGGSTRKSLTGDDDIPAALINNTDNSQNEDSEVVSLAELPNGSAHLPRAMRSRSRSMSRRGPTISPSAGLRRLDSRTSTGLASHRTRRSSEITDAFVPSTSVEDAESLVNISLPPSQEEILPTTKVYRPYSLPVLSFLMSMSIFGVLARLGLQALTTYDGQSIFNLAWVQGAGCFVMGLALGMRDEIGEFYGPLYTAITTGFCGSVTTFSAWQLEVFLAFANSSDFHRDWFRDVIDGLSNTFFTLAISISAVTFGLHVSKSIHPFFPKLRPPKLWLRSTIAIISILMYIATIPLYFLLSPSFRHQATAALLFSFPGTLTRYIFSMQLTPLVKTIPLGTFAANMLATALIGTFNVLQRTPSLPGHNACSLLQGLMDGYCGCLSTVSTFAVEAKVLEWKKAVFYVTLSWVCGQLLLLIILGPSWLHGGVKESVVCSFI